MRYLNKYWIALIIIGFLVLVGFVLWNVYETGITTDSEIRTSINGFQRSELLGENTINFINE